MSIFLEFLKSILCHQDEPIDIIDNETSWGTRIYNSFSSRISSPGSTEVESNSTTRTRNRPQHYSCSSLSSSLLDTNRNVSTLQSRPSDVPVQYGAVRGSDTSKPTSIVSLHFKSVERVNQVPPSSMNSGSYNIYPSPTPTKPPLPSTKPIQPSPSPSPSSLKPEISSKPSSSSTIQAPSSLKPTSKSPASTKQSKVSPIQSPKTSNSSSSSSTPSSSSSNTLPSFKPTLSPLPFKLTDQPGKGKYTLVDPKDTLPIYVIPQDVEDLIKRDIVPEVLKKPLSPSTYHGYFAALLYAEDYYIEKWGNFELKDVSLELHLASICQKSGRNKYSLASDRIDDKTFVVFEVDSLPEKRPFLLARDFVFAQPLGKSVEPFKGLINRVVKSSTVLVDFEEKFHSQHKKTRRYNISFSFNRVCLKRAHQAIAAASASSPQKFLFPNSVSQDLIPISTSLNLYNTKLDQEGKSAVLRILKFRGPPPFLVEGPLCATLDEKSKSFSKQLSITGLVVKEAVHQIYQRHSESKLLVCAPINSTCDVLMRSLKMEIPVSHMFRANAAFREIEGVPIDILPSCLYESDTDCFTCPSLQELKGFRVLFSTFVSSYRLYNAGITRGHFSHIFLVDASSATEPETMVALANFADEKTTVIVSGAPGNRSSFVRSDIARHKGLRISYFERLRESAPYKNCNPMFIAQLAKSVS